MLTKYWRPMLQEIFKSCGATCPTDSWYVDFKWEGNILMYDLKFYGQYMVDQEICMME
jgi:hypothetical protein